MMRTNWLPFGFLAVDKPVGPTSHDIVSRVRRLCPRKTKVGHTGTLDPFASGVLVLGIGKAARFADEIHRLPKSYRAVIRLGEETDTLDPTGTCIAHSEIPTFDQAKVDRIAKQFTGVQYQVPPAYSAKRVDGKKSYELARQNQAVELDPKEIVIHEISLSIRDAGHLECSLICGTGTYVRSLARDIARVLGTHGHLIELVRTSVGPVRNHECVGIDALSEENIGDNLMPIPQLLPQFPEVPISQAMCQDLLHGRPHQAKAVFPPQFLGVHTRIDGTIGAIFLCDHDTAMGQIRPRMLCYKNEVPGPRT